VTSSKKPPTPLLSSSLQERFEALAGHEHWHAVQQVCHRLKQDGFQALLAGGCVRDLLLGREPNDFDVATDATPDQVHAIYPHALTVGKAFGVTILPFSGFQVEVATFRVDLDYCDGRRPSGVRFTGPAEDAKRRDFTVNALFFDPGTGCLLDYVGGENDLRARVIHTVGRAEERFEEDKLRLLRAVRLAAQLDFEIAPETLRAMEKLAPKINTVSRERIRDEILKLLKVGNRRRGFSLALVTGMIAAVFPELNKAVLAIEEQWLSRFERLTDPVTINTVGLALFFLPVYEFGKEHELRHSYLKPLKLDNRQIEAILFSLKHYRNFLEPEKIRLGELVLLLAHRAANAARELATILETGHALHDHQRKQHLAELAKTILGSNGETPRPFVDGDDLKALGVKPGPEIGILLHEAYLLQLEGDISDRNVARAWLQAKVKK
jgi:tRNA nucleotidyltransferase (CCA-adding enzyme)